MKPQALIIRTAGTNCDRELAHAFELAGASPQTVYLNRLIQDPSLLDRADLIAVPGGFSYGDDISAGRIFANRLRHQLLVPLRRAIDRGVAVIGICNGFQVLVKLGLLPDPNPNNGGDASKPDNRLQNPSPLEGRGWARGETLENMDLQPSPQLFPAREGSPSPKQLATLADNTAGRFIAKWVRVEVPRGSVCIWTRGLDQFDLPIAHGEGRFVVASNAVLDTLRTGRQIALRYAGGSGVALGVVGADFSVAGGNPNGSVEDIAGICDPSGLVLGLMPHPERYTHFTNHPLWSRGSSAWLASTPAGLGMFQNAVEHARQTAGAAVADS